MSLPAHLVQHALKHAISHALAPTHQPRRQRAVAVPKVSVFAIANKMHGNVVPPPLPAHVIVRPARAVRRRPRKVAKLEVQWMQLQVPPRGIEC